MRLASVVFSAVCGSVFAAELDRSAYFESIGDLETIPDGVVSALAEDGTGFLWIGTARGLVRFDGYRFRRFVHRESDPQSLAGNLIRSLLVADDGALWVGTEADGLSRFDPQHERFRNFLHDPDDDASLPAGGVLALAAAGDGAVWVGTRGGGIARVDADGRIQRVGAASGGERERIHVLHVDRHGDLWAGTRAGLLRLRGAAAAAPEVEAIAALDGEVVYSLMEADDGRLWVGTQSGRLALISHHLPSADADPLAVARAAPSAGLDVVSTTPSPAFSPRRAPPRRLDALATDGGEKHGLALLDPGDGTVREPTRSSHAGQTHAVCDECAPADLAAPTEGAFDSISALLQVGDEVWMGRNSGIEIRAARDGALLRRLVHDRAYPTGLAGNDVRALLRDRAGLLWVGGYGGGVQRHDPGNRAVTVLRGAAGFGGVFEQPDITAILQRGNGEIWLGTRGHGIAVLDAALTLIGGHPPGDADRGELAVDWVTALAEDRDGTVWLGSREGLHRLDAGSGRFVSGLDGEGAVPRSIRRLLFDSTGRLWLGSDVGLYARAPGAAGFRRLIDDGAFSAIAEDAEGTLWFGATHGLFLSTPGEDAVRPFVDGAASALADANVLGLLAGADGSLWIDTVDGLYRLRRDGRTTALDAVSARLDSEPAAYGANLLQDGRGRIWSHRRLYDPDTGRLHELTRGDGVDFGTGWFRAYAALADGRLLFGGNRGLLVIDPQRFRLWDYAPPLAITELRVDGRTQPPAAYAPELVLGPGARSFSVEFAALDFSAPERLRYAWRLDGDSAWTEADASRRSASYRFLWPGTYRLHVRGSNRVGDFSPHAIDLPIRVLPAWWQTPWFAAAALLALVMLVVLGVQVRTANVRRRARELHALVETRTAEMRQAKERAEDALADLRRTQDQLLAAEKMASLGNLVAGVAHEINTPIGIAVTAASHLHEISVAAGKRLADGAPGTDEVRKWQRTVVEGAGMVVSSLERAAHLIGSFKQVAVDQSSQHRRRFDLGTFLQEVRMALRPSFKRSGHRIEIACPPGIELDTYPGALFQILTNLVQNALRHAFAETNEGCMRIDARRVGDQVQIEFADNGSGMPAEVAARAFEPFFTTSRGRGGSGLGLHVVFNLCTQVLGGRIELASTVGQGSVFTLVLPCSAPRRSESSAVPGWAG